MGKKDKEPLADEELSLKQRYAQLRKLKQQQEKQKEKEKEQQEQAKLEAAKRVLAASLQKETVEDTTSKNAGFKRPVALERKLVEQKEKGVAPEPKRLKVSGPTADVSNPSSHDTVSPITDTSSSNREKPLRKSSAPPRDEPTEVTNDGEYYPTTIFVGDLSESSTQADLESTFVRFGEIDCVRLVSGKNFCFIKYFTREAAQRAIAAMNGQFIDGARVRVHRAKVPSGKGRWGHAGGRDNWHRNDSNVEGKSFDNSGTGSGWSGYGARDVPAYTPPMPSHDMRPRFPPQQSSQPPPQQPAPSEEYDDSGHRRSVLRYDDL
jgi:hypothetical protein